MDLQETARGLERVADELAAVRRSMRSRSWWWAAILAVLVLIGGLGIFNQSQETARLHRLVDKDCSAFRSAGMIPLPRNASPVAHTFVDSFRDAYLGRCTHLGPLPPAPTLMPTPTPGRPR